MDKCEICGIPRDQDLFSFVAQEPVCSICKLKYIGGLPTTSSRIKCAREALGLCDGEFLVQDNAREASKILGRNV